MLRIVLWFFVMALVPSALGLSWKLMRGVGRFIDSGPLPPHEAAAEPRWPPGFQDLDLSSNLGLGPRKDEMRSHFSKEYRTWPR